MRTRFAVLIALLLVGVMTVAQDAAPKQEELMGSPLVPNPAFDKIKTLAGDWEGVMGRLKVTANYKVMGAGSNVVMVLPGDKPGEEMLTIFHTDNEKLMVTHYCSARNQPRMRMIPGGDPNVIKFEFLDATNLPSPNTPHMVGLTIKLLDKDHHVQTWTFASNGKTQTEDFDLHRKM